MIGRQWVTFFSSPKPQRGVVYFLVVPQLIYRVLGMRFGVIINEA